MVTRPNVVLATSLIIVRLQEEQLGQKFNIPKKKSPSRHRTLDFQKERTFREWDSGRISLRSSTQPFHHPALQVIFSSWNLQLATVVYYFSSSSNVQHSPEDPKILKLYVLVTSLILVSSLNQASYAPLPPQPHSPRGPTSRCGSFQPK